MYIIKSMPEYECTACGFITNRKTNYDRHLSTPKHKTNHTKLKVCDFCGAEFGSRQAKWNHEHGSCKKKPEQTTGLIESLVKQLENSNKMFVEHLLEQVKSSNEERKDFLDVLKNANKTAGKSVSTMAYVMKHYDKAPAIRKLTDKNAIKLLEYKGKELSSEEMMIHKYRNNTLDAYLGDIIKSAFLDADNPAKQSMWTSDVARLCFVIMYPMSNGRREWIADKSGTKITELIIEPLLKNAREMLLAYIEEAGKLYNGTKLMIDDVTSTTSDSDKESYCSNTSESNFSSDDEEKVHRRLKPKCDTSRQYDKSLVHNMQTAHDIRLIIDNKSLHESVLKNICPFFKLKIPK